MNLLILSRNIILPKSHYTSDIGTLFDRSEGFHSRTPTKKKKKKKKPTLWNKKQLLNSIDTLSILVKLHISRCSFPCETVHVTSAFYQGQVKLNLPIKFKRYPK